jgi:hypothetical protein
MIYSRELESVATAIFINGMTYGINIDGSFDSDSAIHLRDIEPDGDWMVNLSADDRAVVDAVWLWNS